MRAKVPPLPTQTPKAAEINMAPCMGSLGQEYISGVLLGKVM